MNAESSRAAAEGQSGSPAAAHGLGESGGPDEAAGSTADRADAGTAPARRPTSAGKRLQATLAAADEAAEEILESARQEARELVQRAEQVTNERTAELQTQVEDLLNRASDLTQHARALSEATRELTSSVNVAMSIDAPAVVELELESGEAEPLIAPEAEEVTTETAEPEGEDAAPAGEPVVVEPAPEPVVVAPAPDEGPGHGAAPSPPKRRRSLFSRLRRRDQAEPVPTSEREPRRPRASAEAIAAVSPGHQIFARQMLLHGASQEEIERRLRDEFRVEDPGAVLDSLQLSGSLSHPAKDEANG